MANFDPSFLALRGTPEQLAALAKEFKIYYKKVEGKTPTSYTMDHSAASYVYDTAGPAAPVHALRHRRRRRWPPTCSCCSSRIDAAPWSQHLLGRKGAARIALIPAEVLEALNEGLVPTVNLNEFLALDLAPADAQRGAPHRPAARCRAHHRHARHARGLPAGQAPRARGPRALRPGRAARPDRDAIAHRLATHPSDVARGWATQWIMFSDHAAARQAAIGAPFRGRSAFRRARDGLDGGARRSARGGWTRPWRCWTPGCTTATRTSGVSPAN